MRNKSFLLAVAILGFGVAGVSDALAERNTKDGSATIRLASDTARAGFTSMRFGDGPVYVSERGQLGARDVVAAESAQDGSGGVTLTFAPDVARRLSVMSGKRGGTGLAILVDGNVAAYVRTGTLLNGNRAAISGLSAKHAQRIIATFGRGDDDGTPRTSLVASTTNTRAGALISVDVFVHNVSDLRGYQVSLDAEGGVDGSLDLESIVIDESRADYVFNGLNAFQATDEVNRRAMAALMNDSVETNQAAYLGTFNFRGTSRSRGAFNISVRMNQDTAFLDSQSQPIDVRAGADVRVSLR